MDEPDDDLSEAEEPKAREESWTDYIPAFLLGFLIGLLGPTKKD